MKHEYDAIAAAGFVPAARLSGPRARPPPRAGAAGGRATSARESSCGSRCSTTRCATSRPSASACTSAGATTSRRTTTTSRSKEIVDLILAARPAGLLVEAANPRHAHEWRVWEDVALPEGKVLISRRDRHAHVVRRAPRGRRPADRAVRRGRRPRERHRRHRLRLRDVRQLHPRRPRHRLGEAALARRGRAARLAASCGRAQSEPALAPSRPAATLDPATQEGVLRVTDTPSEPSDRQTDHHDQRTRHGILRNATQPPCSAASRSRASHSRVFSSVAGALSVGAAAWAVRPRLRLGDARLHRLHRLVLAARLVVRRLAGIAVHVEPLDPRARQLGRCSCSSPGSRSRCWEWWFDKPFAQTSIGTWGLTALFGGVLSLFFFGNRLLLPESEAPSQPLPASRTRVGARLPAAGDAVPAEARRPRADRHPVHLVPDRADPADVLRRQPFDKLGQPYAGLAYAGVTFIGTVLFAGILKQCRDRLLRRRGGGRRATSSSRRGPTSACVFAWLFNMWPFGKLAQPLKGILSTVTTLAISLAIYAVLVGGFARGRLPGAVIFGLSSASSGRRSRSPASASSTS